MSSDDRGEFSANQLVAMNMRILRASRRWTQDEAAEQLKPYLGVQWSKASYSAAETSCGRGERIRQFSADDIVALAAAFDEPVLRFFTPGIPAGDPPMIKTSESGSRMTLVEYLRILFGGEEGRANLEAQLARILKRLEDLLPDTDLAELLRLPQTPLLANLKKRKEELAAWDQTLAELSRLVHEARQQADEEKPGP